MVYLYHSKGGNSLIGKPPAVVQADLYVKGNNQQRAHAIKRYGRCKLNCMQKETFNSARARAINRFEQNITYEKRGILL